MLIIIGAAASRGSGHRVRCRSCSREQAGNLSRERPDGGSGNAGKFIVIGTEENAVWVGNSLGIDSLGVLCAKCENTGHKTDCRRSAGHPSPFVQHVKIPLRYPVRYCLSTLTRPEAIGCTLRVISLRPSDILDFFLQHHPKPLLDPSFQFLYKIAQIR